MKRLSITKRNHLILVGMATVLVVAGLWYFLITPQKLGLQQLAARKVAAAQRLQQVRQAIETADQIESRLCEAKKRLDRIEETMASGDLYSWAINTIRQFKLDHKVEIPQFSQIDGPKEMTMLPRFPYKQATLTIGGSAQFHDLGRFVAEFENQFPYMRVVNLSLEPTAGLVSGERERLGFRMDITALVKPGPS